MYTSRSDVKGYDKMGNMRKLANILYAYLLMFWTCVPPFPIPIMDSTTVGRRPKGGRRPPPLGVWKGGKHGINIGQYISNICSYSLYVAPGKIRLAEFAARQVCKSMFFARLLQGGRSSSGDPPEKLTSPVSE